MRAQLVERVTSGRDAERAGADDLAAGDVMRRVADHPDIGRGELDTVTLAGAAERVRAELVAMFAVIGEGTEGEMLPEPMLGELNLRATTQVAGEEALRDVAVGGGGPERLAHAG